MTRFAPRFTIAVLCLGANAAHAGLTLPTTENFDSNAANWFNGAETMEVDWIASGGFNDSGYVSVTETLADPLPPFGTTLFRAQDEYNSSNGMFEGNWEAADATELRFMFRHDAPIPVNVFARIASPMNFPGAAAVSFAPVLPNVWTEVVIPIFEGSPNLVFEGPFTYSDVFGNVGHLQIGAEFDESLAGGTFTFDLDRVKLVPGPAPALLLTLFGLSHRRRRRD